MIHTFKSSPFSGKHYRHYYKPSIMISVLIAFFSFILISYKDPKKRNHKIDTGDITEIQIGGQVWMSKNLDVTTFSNGDSIPQVKSNEEWQKAGQEAKPAWCFYENDSDIGSKYGRLYNWYAVNDPRGLSPNGWHVPTNDDWIVLEAFLGSSEAGMRMKCNEGWSNNGNGNNNSKFCALPGGYRSTDGRFIGIGEDTYLSGSTRDSTEDKKYFIWGRGLHFADIILHRCGLDKQFGLYVRCIKD